MLEENDLMNHVIGSAMHLVKTQFMNHNIHRLWYDFGKKPPS